MTVRKPNTQCDRCAAPFYRQPSRKVRQRGVYCSRLCRDQAVTLPPRKCPVCDATFQPTSRSTKTCSRACGYSSRRKATSQKSVDAREYHLMRNYKIDLAKHDEILANQGGGCGICGELTDRMAVDHDHSCCPGSMTCGGCIRGILCFRCNRALGHLGEDNLEKAVAYLRKRVSLSDSSNYAASSDPPS